MVKPPLAAPVAPFLLGPLDSLSLSLLDEAPFHLRDHPEHREDDMPHLPSRGDARVEHSDMGAPQLTFMDDVEDIAGVAPKAIQPGDDQLIVRP